MWPGTSCSHTLHQIAKTSTHCVKQQQGAVGDNRKRKLAAARLLPTLHMPSNVTSLGSGSRPCSMFSRKLATSCAPPDKGHKQMQGGVGDGRSWRHPGAYLKAAVE